MYFVLANLVNTGSTCFDQVNQGALDNLLDTRQYTTELVNEHHDIPISHCGEGDFSEMKWFNGHQVLERKDISCMTEVPGVAKMTRVLFRYF